MNRIDPHAAPVVSQDAETAPIALAATPDDDAAYRTKARAAAEKFESFFISQMLKQMRAGTAQFADEGSVFKDPVNQDMQGMADGLMADQMSGRHAFGIADAILKQLLPVSAEMALNAAAPAVASDKR